MISVSDDYGVKLALAVLAGVSPAETDLSLQLETTTEFMKKVARLQCSIGVFFHFQVKVRLQLQPLSPKSY